MGDIYSETVGSKIDAKFNAYSFGTNIRGLENTTAPFRRNNTVFRPNAQDFLYPGFSVPPCTFETNCCNMPPKAQMTVNGRLKECQDFKFDESMTRWTYETSLPSHAKKFTTRTVGLDTTEN